MSNALAIATVSAVLKDLLNNGIVDHDLSAALGMVKVTALPPDRVIPVNGAEASQLNLYMYQTAPNHAWRNAALPARDGAGARLANPPLALDLYYLLSAYGADEFHGEILLGYGMQLLHENPLLTREQIRKTMEAAAPVDGAILPGPFKLLPPAELADQVEQIRISPTALGTEEMSRLWSAMQAKYRPTAAYMVSVVLIESRKPTRSNLPVVARNLKVQPFAHPHLESAEPQIVTAGQTLALRGSDLLSATVRVTFGAGLIVPTSVTATAVSVVVPATLTPGVRTVQVKHMADFGTPVEPHQGVDSNVIAFMLAPMIVTPDPMPAPAFSVAAGATLTIPVDPLVGRAQDVQAIVGDRVLPVPPRPATGPATTASIDVALPAGMAPGTYPLRLRVDGAESPLVYDTTTQQFIGPLVQVT